MAGFLFLPSTKGLIALVDSKEKESKNMGAKNAGVNIIGKKIFHQHRCRNNSNKQWNKRYYESY